jgi:hypothetical protein
MSNSYCCCRRDCTTWAIVAAVVAGVLAVFLQVTGVITIGIPALTAALGVGLVALAVLLLAMSATQAEDGYCLCRSVGAALAGAVGTIVLAIALLALALPATGLAFLLLTGLLVAAFTLLLASVVCLIRCMSGCNR